jgi:hypothetical protein
MPLSLSTLAANAGRLPVVAQLALANLLTPDWSFLWPLAALFGAARLARRRAEGRPGRDLLPLTALLYLGAMGAAFVFSAYAPYQQHVLSSWHRLAAHVAPLVVVWIASGRTGGRNEARSTPAQSGRDP